MVTMKDIAKLAHVSQGTVSNVLSNKGNVSADKIKLVKKAAKDLGYVLNAQAQQLRSSSGLSNTVAVVLPNVIQAKYATFFTAVQRHLQELSYNVLLFVSDDSPYIEDQALETIITLRACAVISITCCYENTSHYKTLEQLGCALIFVERVSPISAHYVGFDYQDIGFQVGERVAKCSYKDIGIMTGLDFFSNEFDFEAGVRKAISTFGKSLPNITAIHSSYAGEINSAFQLINSASNLDAIITVCNSFTNSLKQACSVGMHGKAPSIYTLHHKNLLYSDSEINYFCTDYTMLGRQSARLLIDIKSREKQSAIAENIIIKPHGFISKLSHPVPFKKTVLNVLMPPNGSTNALIKMVPDFTKKTNIEVNFVTMPLAELTDQLAQATYNDYFDVVRTNVTTTPSFPAESLLPFSDEYFYDITKTMFDNPVKLFSYINNTPYTMPFDLSIHFQIYRRDLFSDSVHQRTFYETFKHKLEVPSTYDEYLDICKFFTRSYNPESPVLYGSTSFLNENTTIVYDFYRRYQSLGGILFDSNGNLRFDTQITTHAINTFCDTLPYSIHSNDPGNRDAGIVHFVSGQTAISTISTSYASLLTDLKKNSITGRIGFSDNPGAVSSLGGGSLAIPANCKQPEAALKFIEWACGAGQAQLFTLLGGISPHKFIYDDNELTQTYPWFDLLPDAVNSISNLNELSFVDKYEFERLVGGTLRNVYHGIIERAAAADLIKQNLFACMKKR